AKPAAKAAEARLADPTASVRQAAASAVAAIDGPAAAAKLVPLLKDESVEVKKTVLAELAALKSADAVPALLAAASDAAIKFDVQHALTAIPDPRALSLYLDGLTSKNNELRTASRAALVAIRERIAADVVKLHEANELTAAMRSELQTVFTAPSPVASWDYLGPFRKEKLPQLDWNAAPDLKATYPSGDKTIEWRQTETKHEFGKVDATRLVRPNENVYLIAYAAIESESDAQAPILVGSDDQLIVYVNGEKLYEFDANRGWGPEQGRINAKLKKGVNHLYLLAGNTGGPYDFSARIARREPKFAFLFEATPAKLDPSVYTKFALEHAGDAAKGKAIFDNVQGVGCIKCHAVQGVGSKIGPDLVGIGVKYPKAELIRSTLEPSNRILNGYETTIVTTVDGKTISGLLKRETADEMELTLADGKQVIVPKADVDEVELARISLMPNGLKDGLTLEEFADLMAYLESLKEGAPPK
ncbi:MAG TPA: HEAT repeat domain-containing protein, partial [Pirellulales bacterium]